MPTSAWYEAKVEDPKDLRGAYGFCRELAAGRGGDVFIPRLSPQPLRRHLSALAAFLRAAEPRPGVADDPRRRALLEGWLRQTAALDSEPPSHPILLALAETLRELDLPRGAVLELLDAFLRDCDKRRVATCDDLRDICRRAVEPAGRLVLMMHGVRDPGRLELSDRLCAASRMTCWMRDLSLDLARDRVYIPEEDLREAGYSEGDLRMGVVNERFRGLMKRQWKRARALFEESRPLAERLDWPLSWELKLHWLAGVATLKKIQGRGFDTLHGRPSLETWDWPGLMTRAVLWRRA